MGTYSAYLRFYEGFAATVPINIGACDPPEREFEELIERRRQLDRMLAAELDASLPELVAGFFKGEHPYRRYLDRLDPGPAPWSQPEEMWASERVSRGLRWPLPPAPPEPDDVPRLSAFSRPKRIELWFFIREQEPYPLRAAIDGHFVLSRLRGSAPALSAADYDRGRPVAHELEGFFVERGDRSLLALFASALNRPAELKELVGYEDPRIGLGAALLSSGLNGAPFMDERAPRIRGDARMGLLAAQVMDDAAWPDFVQRFGEMLPECFRSGR